MTKSFDAPEQFRLSRSAKTNDRMPALARSERCRAARWKAHVPVFVYGHSASLAPFHEDAYSTVVSDCGALLIMTTAVPIGEKLLLTNKVTQDEQECRVAGIGRRDGPSIKVAVEFIAPASQFWRLMAPPRHAASVVSMNQQRRAQ
jgi:hypothetical protein